jgi:type I restriction enzyme R subunit
MASSAMGRYVSLPRIYCQKNELYHEHFRSFSMHKIGGKAKAMVVTRSRLHAVRYKIAFDEYIRTKGYKDMRTLVAFSGTVTEGDSSYTEVGMNNGLKEKELPNKFATPEYCVLIVAEKYQTGFDQPLLHTMYVDKRLSGIQAIQTLSRLNRTCQGKDDTFVLDFVNEPGEIQASFQPYYEKTIIGDEVDYRKLYELESKLGGYQVYSPEEVEEFCKYFFAGRDRQTVNDHAQLNRIIDVAVQRYNAKSEDEKDDFRSTLIAYRNLYGFLAQIIPFYDSDLEKLYAYLRALRLNSPSETKTPSLILKAMLPSNTTACSSSPRALSPSPRKAPRINGPTSVGTGKLSLRRRALKDHRSLEREVQNRFYPCR